MKREDIEVGETYLLHTSDPERRHLNGKPFKVIEAYPVTKYKQRRGGNLLGMKWRFFNADGVGVPAEELAELTKDWCYVCGDPAIYFCAQCGKAVCAEHKATGEDEVFCEGCVKLPF